MSVPPDVSQDAVENHRIIDLAQPWQRGMPVSPNHPDFEIAMIRRHGDMVRADGGSAANEMFLLGGHVGTHIDALGHVSQDGKLHGDVDAAASQSNHGLIVHGVEEVPPMFCRGVLLDIAAVRKVDVLQAGYEITADDLEEASQRAGVRVRQGDAVLIRSGWAQHWSNPTLFRGQQDGAPGLGEAAARWLVERGIRVAGGETIAFEVVRPGEGHALLPVHRLLLVEAGIYIIEVLNLTELSVSGAHEFIFVASPLKIVGATGSPIRPLAVIRG